MKPGAMYNPDTNMFFETLRTSTKGPVHRGQSVREIHGRDESAYEPGLPDAVFLPESASDAAIAISLCAKAGVPIIPFGVGSTLR